MFALSSLQVGKNVQQAVDKTARKGQKIVGKNPRQCELTSAATASLLCTW
jgi:hypothetical protein